MTIQDIVNLIMNNGIAVICVAYLLYFQNSTMKSITDALENLTKEITGTNTRLSIIESKIDIKRSDD